MAKTQVNFRLDESLLKALREKADTQGIGLTDLVTYLLKQGLESNLQIPTVTQSVNQKEIEEAVYHRISQRIANEITELEKRISQRIADGIVLNEKENPEKTDNLALQNSDKNIEEQCISTTYTQDIQIEKIEEKPENLLFDLEVDEQIMKPGQLANLLNKETIPDDWNIHKLKNTRMKQLTWIKNYKTPNKKVAKESPLPMVIQDYLIDWVISDDDKVTAVGKEWWIKKLPNNPSEIKALINERRNKYIEHYWKE